LVPGLLNQPLDRGQVLEASVTPASQWLKVADCWALEMQALDRFDLDQKMLAWGVVRCSSAGRVSQFSRIFRTALARDLRAADAQSSALRTEPDP
jgi:hypothetical protein